MGGKAPKAPDPAQTAAAQGAWDMTTSQSNAITNNANVVNPYGSTNYSIAGYETIDGPNGQKIRVPRYTQTQTLSDAGQKQFDDRNTLITELFGKMSDGSTDRDRVEKAIVDRANPLLKSSRDSEVARLAAMGLVPGGEKYGRVADQFEKSANDLALGATIAGGAESRADRGQTFGELMAMLTGQQPGASAQTGFQGYGMQSPDYTGLTKDKYDADVGAYNNKQAGIASMAKMLFGFL